MKKNIATLLFFVFVLSTFIIIAYAVPTTMADIPQVEETITEQTNEPTEFIEPTETSVATESTEPTEEPTEPPTTAPTEPPITYTVYDVPSYYTNRGFKSYEDYHKITSQSSTHYKLQNEYALTTCRGLRIVNQRYCIAVGSYFETRIGQYIDVVLENGTVIHCILGDQKADEHTDSAHIAHTTDGSVVEFIVDKPKMDDIPRKMGNVSYVYEEWKSPVAQIIVYDINFFDEVD